MSDSQKNITVNAEEIREIDLKNPWTAGFLAWLVPGLGHIYQGRYFKGILFAVPILFLLFLGLYMGSYYEKSETTSMDASQGRLMIGRNTYFSWKKEEKRLYFIPQAMIGGIAIPAWLQAKTTVSSDLANFLGNITPQVDWSFLRFAMAPPALPSEVNSIQPRQNEVISYLHSWYDVGTIFTVVAGLLNLLVIFDAIGGPVWMRSQDEE